MNAPFFSVALALALAGLTSCGGRESATDTAQSRTAARTDTVATPPTVATKTDTPKVADTTPRPTTPTPRAVADDATDTTTPSLMPGRKRRDSVAFRSTVRFGRRMAAKWPASPTPRADAILPNKRIIAFYGNPASKRMGVLGEYPTDVMLAKLDTVVREWEKADPETPVQPALHLIAVVAQGSAGKDGMWRARMDSAAIEKVYGWAKQRNALLFLDVQVGKSTLQRELPHLMRFLERPDVHLGIDAEFSMHHGAEGHPPGRRIGQFDAADINFASEQLQKLVDEKKIPPKVLVVHRWTRPMISRAKDIVLDPRVQIVMHMDGWGTPWMKFESYRDYIDLEPVEFTGFKIFFHHDVRRGDALLTPSELLWLRPRPMYIQYQ